MWNFQTVRWIGISLMIAASGCGSGSLPGLDAADQLILYSIDGRHFEPGEQPKTAEKLHAFPVLGKIEMTDAAECDELITALKNGVSTSNVARCFWPRHAIRVMKNGRTTDYVICFECLKLYVHDGNTRRVIPVTR